MEIFLHQLLSGLANGGVYAALALALVMIYSASHHINFAQGEMAMFSTYVAWTLITAGIPYWGAFAITIALAFIAGMLIQRLILKPMHSAPVLSIIIVFVGLLVTFNALAGWIWGHTIKTFPSPFPDGPFLGFYLMSWHEVGVVAVTIAVLCVVYMFFHMTRMGLAMRAAAENPVASRLVGIRVDTMLAAGWGAAAAIGAIAGMMVAPILFLDPHMMSGVLLYAFAAALVGGIDNPWGAIVGGFFVGALENLLGAYVIGTELKLTVALAVIIAVLVVKPSGLFGRTYVVRV